MLKMNLSEFKQVLFIGAHSDDIEIGCGGTILQILGRQPKIECIWCVFSCANKRKTEAKRSAGDFLKNNIIKRIYRGNYQESYFTSQWGVIKNRLEEMKSEFNPDLIFTHYRYDRHQDHAILSDLTWNTFRNHLILEYEVPKYDGDLGHPNVFVKLDTDVCHKKVQQILQNFPSQRNKHWFTEDAFLSLMRIRGIECGSAYAEAFFCRKIVLE
jgi:LmbE family N-acetylglucosaminyl deacetylase